jgi:Spy/CpxP family protein refolding chaperone
MHDRTTHDRGSEPSSSLFARWFGGSRRHLWGPGALGGSLMAGMLLASAPAAAAEPDDARPRAGARLCAEIECTDSQREQITRIFQDLHASAKANKEALRNVHARLAVEWAKDKPSDAAMKKMRTEAQKHHAQMAERRHEAMMKVHAILEPAQRQELADLVAEGKMRHMMHPGHGRGGKGKHGDKPSKAKGPQNGKGSGAKSPAGAKAKSK